MGYFNTSNLISSSGVFATDTVGVGFNAAGAMAITYGGDLGVFGFGDSGSGANTDITNYVSNLGIVASNTTAVAGKRYVPGSAQYGTDKGIVAYGSFSVGGNSNTFNLISNTVMRLL